MAQKFHHIELWLNKCWFRKTFLQDIICIFTNESRPELDNPQKTLFRTSWSKSKGSVTRPQYKSLIIQVQRRSKLTKKKMRLLRMFRQVNSTRLAFHFDHNTSHKNNVPAFIKSRLRFDVWTCGWTSIG